MISAGFNDLSGKPLGDFDGFRHTAAFGHEAWTRSLIAAVSDLAHAGSDRYVPYPRDVVLLAHYRTNLNALDRPRVRAILSALLRR